METKLFEIRDRYTFIAGMAIRLDVDNFQEEYITKRTGFTNNPENYVLLTSLQDKFITYDTYDWSNRTMHESHKYIKDNWNSLVSGQVIDIEYILGETTTPRISERLEMTES